MMKLYHAPRSPFAFKVRVLIHALDLASSTEFIATNPWVDEGIRAMNPLCKVPVLCVEEGSFIFDSRTICTFLLEMSPRFRLESSSRWQGEILHALADGFSEAVIRYYVESLRSAPSQHTEVIHRQEQAIIK